MTAASWTRTVCALLLSLGCGQDPTPSPAPERPRAPRLVELPELPNPIPCPAEARAIPRDLALSESGRVASRVLVEGEGEETVGPYDGVAVHLTGWRAADGHNYVNTRGGIQPRPVNLRVSDAFPGLREGLLAMVEGETRRMWLPQNPIGPGLPGDRPEGLIVLDVELVTLNAVPDPPDPLAEPPEDAIRTESGLAYVVLEPGEEGGEHPPADMPVRIHYAGWRAETGECFASTYWDDHPWVHRPEHMIAGLQEGVPLMIRGERRVFWIPAALAYEGRDGPQGTLVFDVRLLAF